MRPKQPKIGEMNDRITVSRPSSGGRTADGGFSETLTELYTLWANITEASFNTLNSQGDSGQRDTRRRFKMVVRKAAVRKGDVIENQADSIKSVVVHVKSVNKAHDEITSVNQEE